MVFTAEIGRRRPIPGVPAGAATRRRHGNAQELLLNCRRAAARRPVTNRFKLQGPGRPARLYLPFGQGKSMEVLPWYFL